MRGSMPEKEYEDCYLYEDDCSEELENFKEEKQARKNAEIFHNKMNSRKSLLKNKSPLPIIRMRLPICK